MKNNKIAPPIIRYMAYVVVLSYPVLFTWLFEKTWILLSYPLWLMMVLNVAISNEQNLRS